MKFSDGMPERLRSDRPIIVVALCAALFVIIFVSYLLYYRPNRRLNEELGRIDSALNIELQEKRAIAENLPKFRAELNHLQSEARSLGDQFTEAYAQERFREITQKAFSATQYTLQSFFLGSLKPVGDNRWGEIPFEVMATGSKDGLERAIKNLRANLPVNVSLNEVQVTRLSTPKKTKMFIKMEVAALAPAAPTTASGQAPAPTEQPAGYAFESRSVRALRAKIAESERALVVYREATGEVGQLKEQKQVLESILAHRAEFAANREREFDQLEVQVRGVLAQYNAKETHHIYIKVKETDLRPITSADQ